MHIVLFEPEIPPNTGNVARLCAATQVELHLIEPLGYSLDDRYLKRAGLDYWPHVRLFVWPNLAAYLEKASQGKRLVASSSRSGQAVHRFPFSRNDAIMLGPETRGLPEDVLALTPHRVRIPICGEVRSLNLSTAAGILLAQALAINGMFDEAEARLGAEFSPEAPPEASPDAPVFAGTDPNSVSGALSGSEPAASIKGTATAPLGPDGLFVSEPSFSSR